MLNADTGVVGPERLQLICRCNTCLGDERLSAALPAVRWTTSNDHANTLAVFATARHRPILPTRPTSR